MMDKRLVRYQHALTDLEAQCKVAKMLSLSMDDRATISKTIAQGAIRLNSC